MSLNTINDQLQAMSTNLDAQEKKKAGLFEKLIQMRQMTHSLNKTETHSIGTQIEEYDKPEDDGEEEEDDINNKLLQQARDQIFELQKQIQDLHDELNTQTNQQQPTSQGLIDGSLVDELQQQLVSTTDVQALLAKQMMEASMEVDELKEELEREKQVNRELQDERQQFIDIIQSLRQQLKERR